MDILSDDYFVYKISFMDTGTVGGDAFNFRVRTWNKWCFTKF